MRVRWTKSAREDLHDVVRHIRQDDPAAARRVAEALKRAATAVGEFPQLGRAVPEYGDESIRERIVAPFRLLYLVDEDVFVLGVFHSRRVLPGDPPGG